MTVRREKEVSIQLSNYVKYALISSQTELNWSVDHLLAVPGQKGIGIKSWCLETHGI